jgi:anti-sigma B factor antagonist
MPERTDLNIAIDISSNGVGIVRLSGSLDSFSTPMLQEKIEAIISQGTYKFVINCQDVPFIGSSGWGVLMNLAARVKEKSGSIVLCLMQAKVETTHELLDLGFALPLFPDEAQALKSL